MARVFMPDVQQRADEETETVNQKEGTTSVQIVASVCGFYRMEGRKKAWQPKRQQFLAVE